ncbi:unnamed protein product, partial [Prorocentrum cordatum]
DYLLKFKQRYQEADSKAGLSLNAVGLNYLLFESGGLPARRIVDIKLQLNGDFNISSDMYNMASRIAKQEMATGSRHHHGHYRAFEDLELNDDDYSLTCYHDQDDHDDYIDFVFDEDTDLHYREYMTE